MKKTIVCMTSLLTLSILTSSAQADSVTYGHPDDYGNPLIYACNAGNLPSGSIAIKIQSHSQSETNYVKTKAQYETQCAANNNAYVFIPDKDNTYTLNVTTPGYYSKQCTVKITVDPNNDFTLEENTCDTSPFNMSLTFPQQEQNNNNNPNYAGMVMVFNANKPTSGKRWTWE